MLCVLHSSTATPVSRSIVLLLILYASVQHSVCTHCSTTGVLHEAVVVYLTTQYLTVLQSLLNSMLRDFACSVKCCCSIGVCGCALPLCYMVAAWIFRGALPKRSHVRGGVRWLLNRVYCTGPVVLQFALQLAGLCRSSVFAKLQQAALQ